MTFAEIIEKKTDSIAVPAFFPRGFLAFFGGFLIVFLIAFLILTMAPTAMMAAEPSSLYSDQTNYRRPTSYRLLGYSLPSKKRTVSPPDVSPAASVAAVSPLSEDETLYLTPPTAAAAKTESELEGMTAPPGAARYSLTEPPGVIPPPMIEETPEEEANPVDEPESGVEYPLSSGLKMSIPRTNGRSAISSFGESPDEDHLRTSFDLFSPAPRRSLCQGAMFKMGHLPNSGAKRSGINGLAGSLTLGFPLPDTDHPLLITPELSWNEFSFPKEDIPAMGDKVGLYSAGATARWLLPMSEVFLFDLSATLRWNSDFHASDSRALRVTGTGCAVLKMTDQSRLVLGASWTGLSGWSVLPVAGIFWQPTDDFYLDATFPRPKIAKRLDCFTGGQPSDAPYWGYAAGGFEGDRSIFQAEPERPGGGRPTAELTYWDYRFVLGLERRSESDLNWAIEGGVVFGRELKLHGRNGFAYNHELHPEPTGVVNLKIFY